MKMSHFHAWALGAHSSLFIVTLFQGNVIGALSNFAFGVGQVLFMLAAAKREENER